MRRRFAVSIIALLTMAALSLCGCTTNIGAGSGEQEDQKDATTSNIANAELLPQEDIATDDEEDVKKEYLVQPTEQKEFSRENQYSDYARLIQYYETSYGSCSIGEGAGYPCLTGLCYAELVDFDRNGVEELVLVYEEAVNETTREKYAAMDTNKFTAETLALFPDGLDGEFYDVQVWGYPDNTLTKLYEDSASYGDGVGNLFFSIVNYKDVLYLEKQFSENIICLYKYGDNGFIRTKTYNGDFNGTQEEPVFRIDGENVTQDYFFYHYQTITANETIYHLCNASEEDGSADGETTDSVLSVKSNLYPEQMMEQLQQTKATLGME